MMQLPIPTSFSLLVVNENVLVLILLTRNEGMSYVVYQFRFSKYNYILYIIISINIIYPYHKSLNKPLGAYLQK